jgi:hypothetical protein
MRHTTNPEDAIMYALVNTMSQIPPRSIGHIVSLHRSREAATRAEARLQRGTRRANGRQSYLPTRIVSLAFAMRRGAPVCPSAVVREEVENPA